MAECVALSVIFVMLLMVFSALPFSTNAKLRILEHDVKLYKPQCAEKHALYCEEASNYPEEEIWQILKNSPEWYKKCFGDEHLPSRSRRMVDFEEDGEPLCQSEQKVIYPKIGQNAQGEYEYIVNTENYTQGVRVELCVNPGSPCSFADSFPLEYKPVCKQNYLYRSFLSYGVHGTVRRNMLQFPSGCQCVVKRVRT